MPRSSQEQERWHSAVIEVALPRTRLVAELAVSGIPDKVNSGLLLPRTHDKN
jgi:hypothetical protein